MNIYSDVATAVLHLLRSKPSNILITSKATFSVRQNRLDHYSYRSWL